MDIYDYQMDNFDLKKSAGQAPKFISTQVSDVRYYYLDLQPRPTTGLTVICGGRERCNAEYAIRKRRLRFHSIECVAQGQGEVTIGSETFRLQAGSVFSLGPNVIHSIRNDPKAPMVKYFVDFTGKEGTRMLARSPVRGSVVQISSPGEIFDLFDDLQRHGGRNDPGTPAICSTLVKLLILKLDASAIPYREADARAIATYQRCKEQIEKRFLEFRTLNEIARACHVNQSYMCRLFKRFDHHPPYRHLMRLKMNRAAELLMSSQLLVKELAEQLGFPDQYHFSRVFKAIHHISPAQFINRGHRGTAER